MANKENPHDGDRYNGIISLSRKIIEWEWYTDIPTCRLFIHCLLKANYKSKIWQGIQINRGQFLTSRAKLSAETGLSEQQVRTALKKLSKELTIESTSKLTKITISKYDIYQKKFSVGNQQDNQQITSKQPASNQQATTTNKDNKDIKDNKEETPTPSSKRLFSADEEKPKKRKTTKFKKPTIKEIEEYVKEKGYSVNAVTFWNHYESNGWKVGSNKMSVWRSAVAGWESRNKEKNIPAEPNPGIKGF